MAVSVAQYAAHRGISPQAVRKAIKEGRLQRALSHDGRQTLIDQAAADREWDANTQGSKRRPAAVINAGKAAAQGRPVQSGAQTPQIELNYTKARAIREHFAAKLAELEYREKAGQLLRADDVKLAVFKTKRLFRDAVQNIPIRVVNEVAALVGDVAPEIRHEMMLVMQREIDRTLEQLSEADGPR